MRNSPERLAQLKAVHELMATGLSLNAAMLAVGLRKPVVGIGATMSAKQVARALTKVLPAETLAALPSALESE